ncbi:MAG: QueT transporter family protein [Clostridia bacterium]|nr:QueT transporter family protein [Clostridia bacterium]
MKRQTRGTLLFIARAAVIAALYAVLTMVLWEISSAGIQFRLSEALCVLPAFTPAAIPGLVIGCAVANLMGGTWIDVVFGSLATLLAALCSRIIGRAFGVGKTDRLKLGAKLLVPLPPVVFNAVIIPFVLYYGYGLTEAFGASERLTVLGLHALTVGAGQAAVCFILGIPLMIALNRVHRKTDLFG